MEAAFFDLDKTLLPGSSLFPLAREMYRQRYFGLRDIWRLAADQVRYRMIGAEAQGPMERAREATLEVIRGRSRDEVIAFGRSVAREEILPRLYPQAVDLMSRHKRAGRAVYIASSSPQDYLELLAEELAIDGVIGTRAEVLDFRTARRRTLIASAAGAGAAASGAVGYAVGYLVGRRRATLTSGVIAGRIRQLGA